MKLEQISGLSFPNVLHTYFLIFQVVRERLIYLDFNSENIIANIHVYQKKKLVTIPGVSHALPLSSLVLKMDDI